MKTLHLPLKKEWYNMIESGIKTEEYREVKPYWEKRMTCVRYMLHKKAILEGYDKPLYYVVKKFNLGDCYKKYEQDSN